MTKSTGCSSRGLEFDSHHAYGGSQLFANSVSPEDLTHFSELCGYQECM